MRTIGLIGGMSWESTVTYYQIINQTIKEKLGGLHSAQLVLYSVNFAENCISQAILTIAFKACFRDRLALLRLF